MTNVIRDIRLLDLSAEEEVAAACDATLNGLYSAQESIPGLVLLIKTLAEDTTDSEKALREARKLLADP